MSFIHSFPPISNPASRILILGSMPGRVSLAHNQYYAHPQNHFWRFMQEIFNISVSASYKIRRDELTDKGVAIWDVLRTCTRSSSLDSDIIESSIEANDFQAFFVNHCNIRHIFFNGAKSESIYLKHILPTLSESSAAIQLTRLPSTSPANASIPLVEKLNAWMAIKNAIHADNL